MMSPVMVGRDPSIQILRGLFEHARTGDGQIALISGEAGIGKSRLVREFSDQLQKLGALTVQGTCFETDQTLPFAPIIDLLRTYLGSLQLEQRSAFVEQANSELSRLLPELRSESGDPQPATDDNEQELRRLQEALARLFIGLAAAQPLVIAVEDVHWCDDASLQFLQFFARRLKTQPILVVLTYRDDEQGTVLAQFLAQLNRERLASELHLARLTTDTVASMVRAILAEDFAAQRKVVEAIHSLSEGNPFFIEEILKSLVAAGDIYFNEDQWKSKPLFELHIPRTIQSNLSQRLDRLTPAARKILSLAAVAGRRFDFLLLQQLADLPEHDLLLIIRELRDAQFVMEESADRFIFRHALTRQAVYNDLLMRERRNLHRAMAEALEQLYCDQPAQLGDIAHHHFQAELWDKAQIYSVQAAEWAQKLYSPGAAVEHYTRAIEALERSGQAIPSALLHSRGQMYERLGNFEAARDDYTRMIEAAQATNDQQAEWQAWLDLAWLWTERDFGRAGEYFAHVLDLVRHMEASPLLAQTLIRWATGICTPISLRTGCNTISRRWRSHSN
ncbi:MAG: AAA family ATPase [Anaerolineae bacterium]